MGELTFAVLIPLVGAILNFSLALLVLFNNSRALVNRVYCLLSICFAVWNYGTYWMFKVQDAEMALFWARFLQFGVIFIPVSFLHLSLLLARIRPGRYILALYAVSILLALSNLTPHFIAGVRKTSFAWYSKAGPGFWVAALLYMMLWLSIGILIQRYPTRPPMQRRRLVPLIFAQIAITCFGDNDILPILGVDHYPIIHTETYPFGSLAAVFYPIIIGYSVLQHQIIDVQLNLSRLAAKVIRLLFIFLLGLGVLLILTLFLPKEQ